jgi:hypothetical protein
MISRWVPEMLVPILITFDHKFSGFVHSTFIMSSHLMGGKGMQNLKWVQLFMKVREYSPSFLRY